MHDQRRRLVGVVDDDAAVRDSLRFLLESAGFAVVAFESAGQFLIASGQESIDLLLVDQHMPLMTGLELLECLRDAGGQVPAALMTGSPSAQLTARALALGARTVLEKPLTEQALFHFVGDANG